MHAVPFITFAAGMVLAGCDVPEEAGAQAAPRVMPVFEGVETRLLDDDLVNFIVQMRKPETPDDVTEYAECAAAQYTLIRGYGFARHVRTNVTENNGVWTGDAVYTISPSLPRGASTIDAEVVVASCNENRIPTV